MPDFGSDFEADGLNYRRLCDQLSVVQAALLIVGLDPGERGTHEYIEGDRPLAACRT